MCGGVVTVTHENFPVTMTTPLIDHRAAAYLAKLPPAVAGNGGHAATFAAACRLVEFGLPFERALPLLLAWNQTHCKPLWTEAGLRHKLADAFKRTSPKPEFATRQAVTHRGNPSPGRSQSKTVTRRAATGRSHKPLALASESSAASVIRQMLGQAPVITAASNARILAAQRGLASMGLMTAWSRDVLRFDNHLGKPAWFILDSSHRNACARRMDGLPWFEGTASECKAVILRGAQAKWPIGLPEARPFPKILLCEGAPDFLAAFHIITALRRDREFAPVVMLSGSYPLHTDALRMFKEKRVRIFAHNDSTGARAAAKWKSQIIGHAPDTDIFSFAPYRVKDLNDFVRGNFPTTNLLP